MFAPTNSRRCGTARFPLWSLNCIHHHASGFEPVSRSHRQFPEYNCRFLFHHHHHFQFHHYLRPCFQFECDPCPLIWTILFLTHVFQLRNLRFYFFFCAHHGRTSHVILIRDIPVHILISFFLGSINILTSSSSPFPPGSFFKNKCCMQNLLVLACIHHAWCRLRYDWSGGRRFPNNICCQQNKFMGAHWCSV